MTMIQPSFTISKWNMDEIFGLYLENLPLCLFTKHNNFLEECTILAQNLTNFVPPKYKFNNLTDTIHYTPPHLL